MDEVWGLPGTPKREAMEARLAGDTAAWRVGRKVKELRENQHLSRRELAERVGVTSSQICKLERGRSSMTLPAVGRVFRALRVNSGTLDLSSGVRVALW